MKQKLFIQSRFVALPLLALMLFVGCSTIDITRYKSEAAATNKPAVIAVVPIILSSGAVSYGPAWIAETRTAAQVSVAEYKSAENQMMQGLTRSFPGVRLIMPPEVDKVMQGDSVPTLESAITRVAQRMSADGVLLFRVRDYYRSGLEWSEYFGGQAGGQSDLTLYNRSGTLLWSISGHVLKKNVSQSVPSFTEFIEYAMEKFQPEIEKMTGN